MRAHLSNTEFMEALETSPTGEVVHHLAVCARCRADHDQLRTALARLAEDGRGHANRPDAAWERQTQEIMAQLRNPQRPALHWRWALAPAFLGLAVLVAVWWHTHGMLPSGAVESDETFLTAVQDSIQATIPAPLQPAALLAKDLEPRDVIQAGDREGG